MVHPRPFLLPFKQRARSFKQRALHVYATTCVCCVLHAFTDLVQGLAKDSENAPSKSQKEGVPSYAAVTRSDGTGKARPASEGSQGQVQTSKEGMCAQVPHQ